MVGKSFTVSIQRSGKFTFSVIFTRKREDVGSFCVNSDFRASFGFGKDGIIKI